MVLVSGFLCRCLACTHLRIYLPGVPVSLSGCTTRTHRAPCMGECLLGWSLMCCGLWIMHASAPRVRGACVRARAGGACSHAHVHRGEAPARQVPHGLWIMHACAPHVYTHTSTQHMHVHGMLTYAHSCCMLITCTHTHTCMYGHAYTFCYMLIKYTHTYMYTCIHVTHPETT